MSLGALGDSFYEYLLKEYIRSGQTDLEARDMYVDAMSAIMQHMIVTSPNGLIYTSDMKFDRLEHKMDHLACFAGMYTNSYKKYFVWKKINGNIIFRWSLCTWCQCHTKSIYRKIYGNWRRYYKYLS